MGVVIRLLRHAPARRRVLVAAGLLAVAAAVALAASLKPNPPAPDYDHNRWGTASVGEGDLVFAMTAYLSVFDGPDDDDGDGEADLLAVPHFVAYELKRFEGPLPAAPDRPSRWITDRALARAGILPTDGSYRYSQAWLNSHPNWYVRGHLCMKQHAWRLGGDADWNTHTVYNAVPQRRDFNSGIWLDLEYKTAAWADRYESVWVVAGPVFEPRRNRPRSWIGEEVKEEKLVAVPDALFKIVVKDSGDPRHPDVLAFLYPQDVERTSGEGYDHTDYLVSVDRIERKTGLDFFTTLTPDEQDVIERRKARALWPE